MKAAAIYARKSTEQTGVSDETEVGRSPGRACTFPADDRR
jgi:hypothetical protein